MAAGSSAVRAFERKRPSRKAFPEHLRRERVVIAVPATCPCCGFGKLAKFGEDITETLEVIPRQRKVTQTMRRHPSMWRRAASPEGEIPPANDSPNWSAKR